MKNQNFASLWTSSPIWMFITPFITNIPAQKVFSKCIESAGSIPLLKRIRLIKSEQAMGSVVLLSPVFMSD